MASRTAGKLVVCLLRERRLSLLISDEQTSVRPAFSALHGFVPLVALKYALRVHEQQKSSEHNALTIIRTFSKHSPDSPV